MTIATLRTKATLDNCLAAACDRSRARTGVFDSIDAVLSFGLTADQMHEAIRAEMDKLPALLADMDARCRRRGAVIDATRYPDEQDDFTN